MSLPCIHCGSPTLWDDSISSAVCTECGSLADPSQSVLTSSSFVNMNDTSEPSLWDSAAPITLKGFRGGNNWDLVGQGKDARDRKNMFAMAEFIKSLAVSFNATGLSPRAITLFNQVKAACNLRWGQKARSVAGACLAIAFRESNRPDSLRDIATLLVVPPKSVSREFTYITTTLKLNLTLVDPSVHISTIQNYLAMSLKTSRNGDIPASTLKALDGLCLRSAAKIAISLCDLLTRLCPEHEIVRLPVAPTACGIFLLALEAEKRTAINPLGDLAQALASSCHSTKSVVMARYKTLQDELAVWIERVPWLDKYETKGGRAVVAKRVVVARGLKEVIQFQDDLWRQHLRPSLHIQFDDVEQDTEWQQTEENSGMDSGHRLSKRQKLDHSLASASNFLLNPLGSPASSASSHQTTVRRNSSNLPLAAYILTNSSSSWTNRPPTRLQILARERGGGSETEIPDEDLFAEGEFEKMWRSPEEVELLKKTFGWDSIDDTTNEASKASADVPIRKARRTQVNSSDTTINENPAPQKRSRLNMDALAQLLADDSGMEEGHLSDEESTVTNMLIGMGQLIDESNSNDEHSEDEYANDYNDDLNPSIIMEGHTSASVPRRSRKRFASELDDDDAECAIDNWRAPTPDYMGDDDCRYEQEYD
ncbi:hypothetical protein D9619_005579 [Psilocybe cf. subviscida]|uniref:TFIIB-type domain-containing protein n=1 Tax=Psilocybe cf. subviscida TaxID=2480587 RepID=A0A8H5BXB0_9AGAR|nr:hypothetical protein D9619_005579 [Psilocybe cf. subviscida]